MKVAIVASGVSACAAVTGLSDYTIEDTPPAEAGTDAAVAADAAVTTDATLVEADSPVDPDAGADACPGPVTRPAEVTAAHVAPGAIVVDGRFADWPCTMRVLVDPKSTADALGASDTRVELSVAWSDDGFYFLARAATVRPPATVSDGSIYLNDGVELFVGREPTDGGYTVNDVQIIIDYLNRVGTYRASQPIAGGIPGLVSETAVSNGDGEVGFVIEAFVPGQAIGRRPLTPGLYPFDLQTDQHTDAGTQASLWLVMNDGGGACPRPACNTLTWGSLRLLP